MLRDARMDAGEPISAEDRLGADVFGKSYREYRSLKPTHYRWSHLAPQSVAWLGRAREENWSAEKLGDYLSCPADEAAAFARRYAMSKKVNGKTGEAARIKQAFREWAGRFETLDEAEKDRCAEELALIAANHLYAAVVSKQDMLKLSLELEAAANPAAVSDPSGKQGAASKVKDPDSPKWGPQWKD